MLCYSAQFWTNCVPVLLSSAWFLPFFSVLRRFCEVLLDVLPILSVLQCSADVLRCSAEVLRCSAVLRRFCDVLLNVLLNSRFCAGSAQFLPRSPRGLITFSHFFGSAIVLPFPSLNIQGILYCSFCRSTIFLNG